MDLDSRIERRPVKHMAQRRGVVMIDDKLHDSEGESKDDRLFEI